MLAKKKKQQQKIHTHNVNNYKDISMDVAWRVWTMAISKSDISQILFLI